MKHLAKMGLILFISSTVSSISQVSLARDFDLAFGDSSKISTVESNAVVLGDRDRYHFSAKAGQRISIAVTSLEDNAAIDVFYKSGEEWIAISEVRRGGDARTWYGTLPNSESNQYRIDVGGTRGNATYDLFVGISGQSITPSSSVPETSPSPTESSRNATPPSESSLGSVSKQKAAQIFFEAYKAGDRNSALQVATEEAVNSLRWNPSGGTNPTLQLVNEDSIYYEGGSIKLSFERDEQQGYKIVSAQAIAD